MTSQQTKEAGLPGGHEGQGPLHSRRVWEAGCHFPQEGRLLAALVLELVYLPVNAGPMRAFMKEERRAGTEHTPRPQTPAAALAAGLCLPQSRGPE